MGRGSSKVASEPIKWTRSKTGAYRAEVNGVKLKIEKKPSGRITKAYGYNIYSGLTKIGSANTIAEAKVEAERLIKK